VLANFFTPYEDLVVEVAGEDKFPARYPKAQPPVWNWPEHYGYSHATVSEVWKRIRRSETFWLHLSLLPMGTWLRANQHLLIGHEVYFVTARPGQHVKTQTECWMETRMHMPYATVLISEEKGLIAKALKLEVYVDDKPENLAGVAIESPETRCYMPVWDYNRHYNGPKRVESMEMVFREEGLLK